jgi:hypothetical protein
MPYPTMESAELAAIKRDYPAWEFEYARDVHAWIAVSRPPQRPEHVLAAHSLDELRDKLEAAK